MKGGRLVGIAVSPAPATFAPLLFSGRLEEGVNVARKLGFSCIELSVRDPATVRAGDVRALVSRAGLAVSAIATGQACLVDGLCLAAADEATRKTAADRFSAQVTLAAELDAAVILGGVRGRLGAIGGEGERRRAAAVEAIRICAATAVAAGVEVMLEPINRYETDFVRTAEEGLRLIDDVGSPALRILLDCFHMNIEERDLAATIRTVGDRLGYVHLVDSNREAPGDGHINFREVFEALDDTGYGGPLVAEILPLPDDLTAARRVAGFLLGASSSL